MSRFDHDDYASSDVTKTVLIKTWDKKTEPSAVDVVYRIRTPKKLNKANAKLKSKSKNVRAKNRALDDISVLLEQKLNWGEKRIDRFLDKNKVYALGFSRLIVVRNNLMKLVESKKAIAA